MALEGKNTSPVLGKIKTFSNSLTPALMLGKRLASCYLNFSHHRNPDVKSVRTEVVQLHG